MRWRWRFSSRWRVSFRRGYGPIVALPRTSVLPIEKIIGQDQPFVFIPIVCFVCVVMLGWPQVAFALIGGFLSLRFKITITRR